MFAIHHHKRKSLIFRIKVPVLNLLSILRIIGDGSVLMPTMRML